MKKLLSVAALLMIALFFFTGCPSEPPDPNALPGLWTTPELNTSPTTFWLNKGNLIYNNEDKTFVFNCNTSELTGDNIPGDGKFQYYLHLLTTDENYSGFKSTVSSTTDTYYGFVFNCTYSGGTWSYYVINFYKNKFLLQKMVNDQKYTMNSWSINSAINASSTENEILVYKDTDSSIVIKVNGQSIYTITNPQLTSGRIGVSCCVSDDDYNNGTEITTTWKFKEFQR